MEFQVVIPVLISFAISVVLGPVIIPFLRRLKMGQTERTEGVQSHLKKAGTPTMGGVILSDRHSDNCIILCRGLSEDHSGTVPDSWIWNYRISG